MTAPLRRAFLAVVLPAPVMRWTEVVAAEVRHDGDGLRWSPPAQRHLTVQFLGAVPDTDALVVSVAASVRPMRPFTLVLGGAGAFPSARRASVLWLGVRDGADELAELAGVVTRATASLGFAVEDRRYHPHLTLARIGAARDVRALVERLGTGPAAPPFTVDHVVLFESDTRPDGAVHTEVARCPLTAGTGSAPC